MNRDELEIRFTRHLIEGRLEVLQQIPEANLRQACAMMDIIDGHNVQVVSDRYGYTRNWIERVKSSTKRSQGLVKRSKRF